MYKIILYHRRDGFETDFPTEASRILYDGSSADRMILEGSGKDSITEIPTFDFSILPNHPLYNEIVKFKTFITVYFGTRIRFYGRVVSDGIDFYGRRSVSCEGALGCLLDSIQDPREKDVKETPRVHLQKILTAHNTQMADEPYKCFTLGNVTVDAADKSKKFEKNESYSQTKSLIDSELIGEYKGFLRARYENGTLYLDWLKSYTKVNPQPIKMAVNLLDRTIEESVDDYYTVLLPIGANKRTIASVNGGSKYLEDPDSIKKYGRIIHPESYGEAKTSSALMEEARKEMAKRGKQIPTSVNVTAVDMSLLGSEVATLETGDKLTNVESGTSLVSTEELIQQFLSAPRTKAGMHDLAGQLMTRLLQKGNVDLLNRPKVTASAMRSAGWSDFEDGTATVYSLAYWGGDMDGKNFSYPTNVIIHATPILANGTVRTPSQIDTYAQNTLSSNKSIASLLAADKNASKLVLWVQEADGDWDSAVALSDRFDELLHVLQAIYYLDDFTEIPTAEQLREFTSDYLVISEIDWNVFQPQSDTYILENQEAVDKRHTSSGNGSISSRTGRGTQELFAETKDLTRNYHNLTLDIQDTYTLMANSIHESSQYHEIITQVLTVLANETNVITQNDNIATITFKNFYYANKYGAGDYVRHGGKTWRFVGSYKPSDVPEGTAAWDYIIANGLVVETSYGESIEVQSISGTSTYQGPNGTSTVIQDVTGVLMQRVPNSIKNFDPNTQYYENEYVKYDNKTYKCLTPHKGEFNKDHFSLQEGDMANWHYEPVYQTDELGNEVYDLVTGEKIYQLVDGNLDGERITNPIKSITRRTQTELYDVIGTTDTYQQGSVNEFDKDTQYTAGMTVKHNNKFYRFITDHKGPWDWDHVEALSQAATIDGKQIYTLTSISGSTVFRNEKEIDQIVGEVEVVQTKDASTGEVIDRQVVIKNGSGMSVTKKVTDFSETATYNVGDYVRYNNVIYQFVQRHTAGTWNDRHVVATTEPVTTDSVRVGLFSNGELSAGLLVSAINSNAANIAGNEFSASKDYAVGDLVKYGNAVWRFTTAHPKGPWDYTHVTLESGKIAKLSADVVDLGDYATVNQLNAKTVHTDNLFTSTAQVKENIWVNNIQSNSITNSGGISSDTLYVTDSLSIGGSSSGGSGTLYFRGEQYYKQIIRLGPMADPIATGNFLGTGTTTLELNHHHSITITEETSGTHNGQMKVVLGEAVASDNNNEVDTAFFNIADTQVYRDGVSAAKAAVIINAPTLSAQTGPLTASRTITVTTDASAPKAAGATRTIPLYLNATQNWTSDWKKTVSLVWMTPSGSAIAQTDINAYDVYRQGVTDGTGQAPDPVSIVSIAKNGNTSYSSNYKTVYIPVMATLSDGQTSNQDISCDITDSFEHGGEITSASVKRLTGSYAYNNTYASYTALTMSDQNSSSVSDYYIIDVQTAGGDILHGKFHYTFPDISANISALTGPWAYNNNNPSWPRVELSIDGSTNSGYYQITPSLNSSSVTVNGRNTTGQHVHVTYTGPVPSPTDSLVTLNNPTVTVSDSESDYTGWAAETKVDAVVPGKYYLVNTTASNNKSVKFKFGVPSNSGGRYTPDDIRIGNISNVSGNHSTGDGTVLDSLGSAIASASSRTYVRFTADLNGYSGSAKVYYIPIN